MQTLEFHSKAKQKKVAQETLEIYVPPAYYIGFWKVMRELEDISFKALYPEAYEKITEYYTQCDTKIGKMVQVKSKMLEEKLLECGIKAKAHIFWRRKYNFYLRTNKLKKDFSEFSSPIGVEVLVENGADCYRAIEMVHGIGNPRFDKLKDFIACPKENGYSAFHTSIFCSEGSCIDIHILSEEMKKRNDLGFFKTQIETQSFSNVLNEIITMQDRSNNKMNLFKKVKQDILKDRIHVFSTKGKVASLAKGATVIDFAFHLEKQRASHLIKVKINNKVSPIHSFLSNGDSVELTLSPSPQITFHWFSWCKSSYAQKHIKEFLHGLSADIAYEVGKQQLLKYIQRFCGLSLEEAHIKFQPAEKLYNCNNKKDLYVKIGRSEIEISQFLKTTFSEKDLLFSTFALGTTSNLKKNQNYVKIQIKSQDRVGLLNEIIKTMSKRDINITENSSYVDAIKRFVCEFVIGIKTFDQLFEICEEIENIKGIEVVLKV
ncbi:bifunctional (p)ppGpp synthetase/guanosine-3',5'-bis(diphosphate) 3'-pyrophosphohydrolase [Candidatus Peregrinibacteria bacterium]|nr:bifunctional (p)ppGpp synthetase/guanosine-3',5'-bis(diphosphate) 3'-pyrophosphohydrolase [Candidatus Peregrinibacteria bacterium]